jgi:leader peptidase (prepilin peptidase) / N-methyltransferase
VEAYTPVVLPAAGLLGLVIGSFLNVLVHRLPRGESLVSPPSRCPECSRRIRPLENVPLVSWCALRGRCAGCARPISVRYPLIELATGALFVLVSLRFGLVPELGAFLVLAAALVAISAIDIEHRLIPKRIVWPAFAAGALFFLGAAAADGLWRQAVRAGIGAAAAFAVLFTIHLISPRGMGFGDVRLAGLLGLHLGWLGWGHVGLGLFAGFLAGGVAGVVALLAGRSRRSALPFGPFLAFGTLATVLVGNPVVEWYIGTLT